MQARSIESEAIFRARIERKNHQKRIEANLKIKKEKKKGEKNMRIKKKQSKQQADKFQNT